MENVKIKTILIAFFAMLISSPMKAESQKPIKIEQLPEKAQTFIKQNFPDEKIALASVERDFLEITYKVIFSNSAKVEFRRNGEWKEVNCKFLEVPGNIIPQEISNKIKDLYPNCKILEIEKSSRDYEVKLSTGMELTFDLNYNIIKIDD